MTTALLVLVAALTITASQSAPPAIAEFAPQAVEQIKEAPQEQTSSFGSGDGGAAGGGEAGATSTTLPAIPTTTLPPIERARVRRCVGDPPRQTEDPHSPPCVPYWQGDNGGATYAGVTADTITVAVPGCVPRECVALETFFNKRFEFYGRKLKIVEASPGETCAERKAAAVKDVEEKHIFGATTANFGNAGACYNTELARRKLISVMADELQFADQHLEAFEPYMWQYSLGINRMFEATGEMICNRLHGQVASRSPDPFLRTQQRTYGVILQNVIRDTEIEIDWLLDSMARCGAKVRPEHVFILSTNDSAGLERPELAQAAVNRLKIDGVTTVVNYGIAFVEQNISAAADAQAYYPEWVFSSYGGNDTNVIIPLFWPHASQRQSIMGVSGVSPMRAIEAEPGYWAFKEADPTVNFERDLSNVQNFVHWYKAVLLLASGIQMAGPRLTPETFERGLHAVGRFPYPKGEPTKAGDVSLIKDYTLMGDDFSEYWWSDAAIAPRGYGSYNGTGAMCYVNEANRVRIGAWPKQKDPFFTGPCYTGPTAADGAAAGLG